LYFYPASRPFFCPLPQSHARFSQFFPVFRSIVGSENFKKMMVDKITFIVVVSVNGITLRQ